VGLSQSTLFSQAVSSTLITSAANRGMLVYLIITGARRGMGNMGWSKEIYMDIYGRRDRDRFGGDLC